MDRRALLVPLCLVVAWVPARARAEEPAGDAVLARVRDILESKDAYAAAEYVQRLGPPPEVAKAYAQLVMDLYGKAKDAAAVVEVGRAGILYVLTRAEDLAATDPEKASAWRAHAKSIAYNVGSFTWPGWGEEGIRLTDDLVRAGREAADLDLRLAEELDEPAGARAAAHWLVGAHRLARGDFDGASEAFGSARDMSHKANDVDGERMAVGYTALAHALDGEADGADQLAAALYDLRRRTTENATFYADQIEKAKPALSAWLGQKSHR